MPRTRVTLSLDEILDLRAVLAVEIQRLDKYVETIGDPDGLHAKERARSAALYDKLGEALRRV